MIIDRPVDVRVYTHETRAELIDRIRNIIVAHLEHTEGNRNHAQQAPEKSNI
jgi:hypothetical protein